MRAGIQKLGLGPLHRDEHLPRGAVAPRHVPKALPARQIEMPPVIAILGKQGQPLLEVGLDHGSQNLPDAHPNLRIGVVPGREQHRTDANSHPDQAERGGLADRESIAPQLRNQLGRVAAGSDAADCGGLAVAAGADCTDHAAAQPNPSISATTCQLLEFNRIATSQE